MKIVQIFPGKIWGGAEQYILDLSHQLRAQGHDVVFVCHNVQAVTSRLKDEPFETHALRMRWPFDPGFERTIAEIIADADVVHIHDASFVPPVSRAKAIAGSGRGRPSSQSNAVASSKTNGDMRVVLTRHIARGSRTWPWRRRYFRGLHRMIFVSDLACRLWSDANPWMPEHLMTTIHNSIPPLTTHREEEDRPGPARDTRKSLRVTYGIVPGTPLLVFTGRVRRSKGCEVIIRALAKVKQRDFAMVFIGACKPAGYDSKLQALADQLGIGDRVHFYGFSSEARSLIGEADIALAPSIVREACPLSPMEYMQQGIAVIATDNGAQPEYITDGETGMLIPPADIDALANKISMLIDDPQLRANIGMQAKNYFDNHLAYYAFINKVQDVYR